jgi:hypothetical protein
MAEPDSSDAETQVVQRYWALGLRGDGIVCLTRRATPYPDMAAFHQSYNDFLKVVDDWLLDRRIKSGNLGKRVKTPMAWLTDMREAPDMRNDSEFEAAVKERRPDLLKRSPALAILVGTSAGRMQLSRITRERDFVLGVFSDPAETVAWLVTRMAECFPPSGG